jgi:hypothetical protein
MAKSVQEIRNYVKFIPFLDAGDGTAAFAG